MKLLEKVLTKIPMYTVVAGGLGLLVLSSLLLSLTGALSFDVGALATSLAVFSIISVITSYSLGRLYGVPSHLKSSLITALILTLLFTPSVDFGVLTQYAFITVIAQASKYVLTFRRRHIFNPAAIGAFIGGAILQLQFASWWVATPVLFIPLFIAAFLVLYKTRELALGSTFIVIATITVTIAGLLRGEGAAETLLTAVMSWPIIFVAGFMLSEPLTLPPRKWQRLLIAIAAAIIVAIPFHIGSFYSSPEFALIVANLIAFILAFRQRRQVPLTLKGRRALTPTSYEFLFTTDHSTNFTPGQYIELMLPHSKQDVRGSRRTFSITSVPGSNEIRLGIKFYEPGSSFKKKLLSLKKDDCLETTGINGDFVLPRDKKEKLLFVAGGIGITPFISHLRTYKNEARDITLLYFIRNSEEAAYKDELDASGIDVVYCVSEGAGGYFLDAPFLNDDVIKTWVTDLRNRVVYVSGPPPMVTSAKQLLKGQVKHLYTDYFSGY